MARQNYSFERRQRDLARKKKAEEKLARKIAKSKGKTAETHPAPGPEDPDAVVLSTPSNDSSGTEPAEPAPATGASAPGGPRP